MKKVSLSELDLFEGPLWSMMPLETTWGLWSMLRPHAMMKPEIHVDICNLCHCLMP